MRPLAIDFLDDSPTSSVGARWARRALWSGVLLLVVGEAVLYLEWQGENDRLARLVAEMSKDQERMAAARPPLEIPDQPKVLQALASVSAFDPTEIARIEQAVTSVRSKAPEARLRLNSLSFDARQRKIVLQGESRHHNAINRLRDEILLLLPRAVPGFPSSHDKAIEGRAMQFEISIRLPPKAGGDR